MRLKPRETLHFCIHDFMGLRSLFLWIWTKYLWCLSSKSLFYPLIILWIPFSLILRYVCLHFAEKKGDVARNLMSNEFLALSSFCVHFIRVCASTQCTMVADDMSPFGALDFATTIVELWAMVVWNVSPRGVSNLTFVVVGSKRESKLFSPTSEVL